MMKYRMLALDIDGTLFDSTGRPPQANLDAVRRAREAGILVVLCTGRGLKESASAIAALDHDGPLVLANGALISDPKTGRTLHRAVIEPHRSLPVVEFLSQSEDAVLVLLDPSEVEHDYLVIRPERLTRNTRWWFDHVGATYRGVDRVSEADLHHAVRVGIVGPASHMPPVQQALLERFGDGLFVQHFMAVDEDAADGEPIHVLEVFNEGVNKWSALEQLARQHRIDVGEVAAIGDHINDVQMIRGAGCGIAMANAVAQVRENANYHTASNDAAGVAEAIDKLLSGQW